MPWPHGLPEARTFLRGALPGYTHIWVATDAGGVRGMCTLRGNYLAQLFVDVGYQRCGIGTALLDHVLGHTTGPIELHTFEANVNARAFYEKHGFAAVAFGTSPEESQPDVLYRLDPQR